MIILLTGAPGVGKSTVIEHFINYYSKPVRWVMTKEIRDSDGARVGFRAVTSSGEEAIVSHKIAIESEFSVGANKVDVSVVDQLFPLAELGKDRERLVVIDEIGPIQLLSRLFRQALGVLFSAPRKRLLIATIHQSDVRLVRYKAAPGVIYITLTMQNRNLVQEALGAVIANRSDVDTLQAAQLKRFSTLLQQALDAAQPLQLHKLLNNALKYVVEGRVKRRGFFSFIVRGNYGEHHVVRSGQTYLCDCDLANGSGVYHGQAGVCSHMQAVMIAKRA